MRSIWLIQAWPMIRHVSLVMDVRKKSTFGIRRTYAIILSESVVAGKADMLPSLHI